MKKSESVRQWWKEKKTDVHEAVFEFINYLNTNQAYRREDNLRNMRLYGNLKIAGMSASMYNRTEDGDRKNRVTLNIVQSMCDTITNKVAKNKTKIMFLTEGGDWTAQQKAKKLNKFTMGQFFASKVYETSPYVFLDCTVFDFGVAKIYEKDSQICFERVFPDEVRVDEAEAMYGDPLQIHQEKDIPRDVLLAMFPKSYSKIMTAKRSEGTYYGQYQADLVHVVESWKRKASEDDIPGKHAISIENETLLFEDYDEEDFPFVFLRWAPRLRGFGGQSLAERLTGKQLEINKILRTIQIAQHLISVPKVLMDASSDIVSAHLNNQIGGIVKYSGIKPDYITPSAINNELYAHLQYLVQSAYEEAGISQLSASSKKPEGLDSGKAIREYNDIETERFVLTGQMWDEFHIKTAEKMIKLVQKIYERDGEYSVQLKGKKFLETIDWGEINLEEDQYVMQPFPTSFLSQTPSGRLQDVTELYQAGFIDKENAMGLLDFPDLEAYTSLATAQLEDVDKQIEMMIEKGKFVAPEPYQNLTMGMKRVQSAYLRAKIEDVPEERLELLRRWMEMAQKMTTPPIPQAGDPGGPQMPAPEVPMEQPIAQAEPAPVSPLVPQV